MKRIKYAKNRSKKNAPFFAFVASGDLLVEILTSPFTLIQRFQKNSSDRKKVYRVHNN